ncbi:MAG TPA: type II secretion system protein [Verrucomicrobiales bacterium]|jgi:prepilin-type N-terminal cleavage/methylation domain-containing protein|nr:type II secretion system protein [Verrucomicrobiales bacterium]
MIPKSLKRAFTLVEMLLVIAIISILAGLVISNISNAAHDTRDVVARQQLAVVQEAVNHWVNREIGRVNSAGATGASVNQVMATYNAASTASARYALFQNYLDDATRDNFTVDNTTAKITSQAMRDVNKYLTLPNWAASSYPKVQLQP